MFVNERDAVVLRYVRRNSQRSDRDTGIKLGALRMRVKSGKVYVRLKLSACSISATVHPPN